MGSQGETTTQEPRTQSLAYQGSSFYNLTLDEVQNQLGNLGKQLGSMNLDELLKSVGTAETSGQLASGSSSMHRQNSMTLLSGDVRKKTVDEVWRDIQQHKKNSTNNKQDGKSQERQATLGEMTLEDFLAKAGVIFDSNVASNQHNISSQEDHWIQYQLSSSVQQHHQNHHHHQHDVMAGLMAGHGIQQQPNLAIAVVSSNQVLDSSYSENMVATISPSSLMGNVSDTHSPGRKREASGGDVVEKTMERRKKRMIKNRESAARSRARKQAYTQELEIKISRLEEENERLRRQYEMEKELPYVPPTDEPKHKLRRTSSASF